MLGKKGERGRVCSEAIDAITKLTPASFSVTSGPTLTAFPVQFHRCPSTGCGVVGAGVAHAAGNPATQCWGWGPSEGGLRTHLPRGDGYYLWAVEVISLLVS